MNHIQKLIFVLFIGLGCFVSCSDNPEECAAGSKKKVGKYQMRQDSELTTLMKEMEADMKRIKADIAAGKPAKPGLDYAKIMTAHATDEGESKSESFQAFAKNFLQVLDAFEKSEIEKSTEIFETLVTSCKNCHQVHCPGPIVRIEKLY